MKLPAYGGYSVEACGACGICGVCGVCGPSHILVAGALGLAAAICLF